MAPLCNLRRWRRWRLGFSGMEYKFYMIHIYLYKIYKGFLLPPEGVPTLGLYSPLISLCAFVLSLTVLLCLWYWSIYIYMTCSIIMLVMVVVGINSALVMVALVLNRTACRRPGLRDDNYSYSYRPASLDGDMCTCLSCFWERIN